MYNGAITKKLITSTERNVLDVATSVCDNNKKIFFSFHILVTIKAKQASIFC